MKQHISEESLQDYFDGLLKDEKKQAIDHHLENCPDCRDRFYSYQRLYTLLSGVPPLELSPNFSHKVMAALAGRREPWFAKFGNGALTFAGLIIAIVLSLRFMDLSKWESGFLNEKIFSGVFTRLIDLFQPLIVDSEKLPLLLTGLTVFAIIVIVDYLVKTGKKYKAQTFFFSI